VSREQEGEEGRKEKGKEKGFFDWCHYNFWSSDICHYNSTIPKHAITIPSFTEPRHFLRIPRHRAHPQAYAYGRTPVVDAFAPPLASIGAGSPLPPLARSHSLPLPLLFPPGDGGGTLTLARRSTESIPAAASRSRAGALMLIH